MSDQVYCPICGEPKNFNGDAAVGRRTFCRCCWALLEVRSVEPVQVEKIPHQAEDFGV